MYNKLVYKQFKDSYRMINRDHEFIMVSKNTKEWISLASIWKNLSGVNISITRFKIEDNIYSEEVDNIIQFASGSKDAEIRLKSQEGLISDNIYNAEIPSYEKNFGLRGELNKDLLLWLNSEELLEILKNELIPYSDIYNKMALLGPDVEDNKEEFARMIFNLGAKLEDIDYITIENKETYLENALLEERIDIDKFIHSFFKEDQELFANTALDFKVELLAHVLNKSDQGKKLHLVSDKNVCIIKLK